MKRQRRGVIIVLFLFSIILCGCSTSGIDEQTVVEGIIVTKSDDGLEFKFAVLNAEMDEKSVEGMKSDSVKEAVRNLEIHTSREPFFGQTQYLLISDNIDRNTMIKLLEYFSRELALPPNTVFFIVTENAEQYIYDRKLDGKFFQSLSRLKVKENKNSTLMACVSRLLDEKEGAQLSLLDEEDGRLLIRLMPRS